MSDSSSTIGLNRTTMTIKSILCKIQTEENEKEEKETIYPRYRKIGTQTQRINIWSNFNKIFIK